MGILDYGIMLLLAFWLIGACIHMRKRKKSGKCIGCSGDCSQCNK